MNHAPPAAQPTQPTPPASGPPSGPSPQPPQLPPHPPAKPAKAPPAKAAEKPPSAAKPPLPKRPSAGQGRAKPAEGAPAKRQPPAAKPSRPAKKPPAPAKQPPAAPAPEEVEAKRQPAKPRPKAEPAQPPSPKQATAKRKPAQPKAEPPKPARKRPKALRPEQFVWAFPEEPPYADEAVPLLHAPAVDAEGRVFLHMAGRLTAIDEKDGKAEVAWEYVTGSHVPGPVVIGPDGGLRLHCSDGYLHCVSNDGKQVFSPVDVGQPLGYAAPIVDPQGNTYISFHEGGLIRVDAEGKRLKSGPYFRTRQKLDAAAVIRGDVLYIGSEDGYIFALELGDRRGRNRWDQANEQGYAGGCVHSAPAVRDDDMLVVAGRDEHLYGFSSRGERKWKAKLAGQILGSPVLDALGHVYVGVSQSIRGRQPHGALVCVDGNSHKVRWEYQAAGPVESTPVIGDDGLVYFGDNAGTIHAVDSRGTAQWTAHVEAPVRSSATIIGPHRLAFGLDDETLVVLECTAAGLANSGWPKWGRNLAQDAMA